MSNNEHAYALLIGVGDYRAYDASGAYDLGGSVADALGWWSLTRRLGIPPENVRICAAPALDRGRLGKDGAGVTISGASGAEIEEGLRWLAGKLDGEGGTKGLMTYSGHGGHAAAGQVICPSDVRSGEGGLVGALSVRAMADVLDARAKLTRLTVFVDTCHTREGVPVAGGTARSLTGGASATDDDHAVVRGRLGDLVVASSRVGTPSYEIPLADGVRGAFSWGVQSMLARWGTAEGDKTTTFGLSYGDLCARGAAMLRALGIEQQPVFEGEPAMAGLRAFSGFGDRAVGDADASESGRLEIWPDHSGGGRVIEFDLNTSPSGGGTSLGTLYLTDANPPSGKGWTADRMYWDWSSGAFPAGDFYAVPTGVSSASAPTGAVVFEASPMAPAYTGSTTSIPSGHYKISEVHHSGYVKPDSSELVVYSSVMGTSSLASGFSTLSFDYTSGTTISTIYSSVSNSLK